MTNKQIMVFIPAYNCERQIARVLTQFTFNILQYLKEIVLVNNLSTDHTEDVAIQYAKEHDELPLTVLRNGDNYNLGGSHKVAFQYAMEHGYDYIIVLHGDDQAKISDLYDLLESGKYQDYDVLLGARFVKGATLEGYSLLRKWGNIGFNLLYSVVTRRMICDLGSGINMFSMQALKDKFYFKMPDSLGFNNCMLLAICHKKLRVKFFPILWREEDQVSNLKLWDFGLFNLRILWRYFWNPAKFVKSEMRTTVRDSYDSSIIYQSLGGKEL